MGKRRKDCTIRKAQPPQQVTSVLLLLILAWYFSACALADSQTFETKTLTEQSGTPSSPIPLLSTPNPSEMLLAENGPQPDPQQSISNTRQSSFRETEISPIIETRSVDSSTPVLWGEFIGAKTNWEEMKKKLAGELQEQERQIQETQAKLQLIDHLAQRLDFTTKAYLQGQLALRVEFRIENQTGYAIKDLSITCEEIAPSGTSIQTHTETVYEIIPSQTQLTFPDIHFGNKHPQTQKLRCQITNFTVHNS